MYVYVYAFVVDAYAVRLIMKQLTQTRDIPVGREN